VRCNTSGCGSAPASVTSFSGGAIAGIGAGQNQVYFASGTKIYQCAEAGCGALPVSLTSPSNVVDALVTDGATLIYSLGDGSLNVCAVPGCLANHAVAQGQGHMVGIASDGQDVFFVDNSAGTVGRASLGTVTQPTIIAKNLVGPRAIAIDPGNVYFTTDDGQVMKVSKH
jgi:hypothetical protein